MTIVALYSEIPWFRRLWPLPTKTCTGISQFNSDPWAPSLNYYSLPCGYPCLCGGFFFFFFFRDIALQEKRKHSLIQPCFRPLVRPSRIQSKTKCVLSLTFFVIIGFMFLLLVNIFFVNIGFSFINQKRISFFVQLGFSFYSRCKKYYLF